MGNKSRGILTSKTNRDAGRAHSLPLMATRELVRKAWRSARKQDARAAAAKNKERRLRYKVSQRAMSFAGEAAAYRAAQELQKEMVECKST